MDEVARDDPGPAGAATQWVAGGRLDETARPTQVPGTSGAWATKPDTREEFMVCGRGDTALERGRSEEGSRRQVVGTRQPAPREVVVCTLCKVPKEGDHKMSGSTRWYKVDSRGTTKRISVG